MQRERSINELPRFASEDVARAFAGIPDKPREKLLELRALIFSTAAQTPEAGPLDEALRWGEPSYLTSKSKAGTTIRIHWKQRKPEVCAMYVHCQTNLIERFRRVHGGTLRFEGNRAVLLGVDAPLPADALRDCIRMALTYHLPGSDEQR